MAIRIRQLRSLAELRSVASLWDDLWLHSDVADPTARAELLAQWIEQFAPNDRFLAMVVEEDGVFMIALPLVGGLFRKLMPVGNVPSNAWAHGAGLLVRQPYQTIHMRELVGSLGRLPWQVLWFERVRIDDPGYREFLQQLSNAKISTSVFPQYEVAFGETDGSWTDYFSNLKSSTRKSFRKWEKRLNEQLNTSQIRIVDGSESDLTLSIRSAFELENRSWKGNAGSSVIGRGLLPYFERQANTLGEMGHVALYFLESEGIKIAFQYGYLAKGVFHDCKTSFDSAFKSAAPGHLLYKHILNMCFDNPEIRHRDNLGGISEAMKMWNFDTYRAGQILVAPRGICGRFLVYARKNWWPLKT